MSNIYQTLFYLSTILFSLCLLMFLLVDKNSAECYIMIVSLVINLVLMVFSVIKIKKRGNL